MLHNVDLLARLDVLVYVLVPKLNTLGEHRGRVQVKWTVPGVKKLGPLH
jgi:hypothetical protein